jgi:branched-chain amino acid transport system ATP-binding protein
MPLLEAKDVTVTFGGKRALDAASISVDAGRITGLIGPNGAGKTTLFNVMTGLLAPDRGEVFIDGRDVTRRSPHRRAQLGLARTFQRLELFTSLSVRDNIRVAGDIRNSWGLRGLGRSDAQKEAERVIELTGLGAVADREVAEIPTGQARVVELARALMTQPKVLLLDEPASGQTEQETEAFGRLLRRLAGDGLAICLVEHDMTLVMDVCETIHVLDYGKGIAAGAPEEIRTNQAVVDAYLGTPEGVSA